MDPQSLLDEALFLGGDFFTVLTGQLADSDTAQPACIPEAANAEGASGCPDSRWCHCSSHGQSDQPIQSGHPLQPASLTKLPETPPSQKTCEPCLAAHRNLEDSSWSVVLLFPPDNGSVTLKF